METITIRISSEDKALLKDFANFNNISVSDLLRQSAMEKIEDEIDIKLYKRAEKILANTTDDDYVTFDELLDDLGIAQDEL